MFEIEVENYNAGSLFSFQLGFMEYPPILRITSPTDDISLFRDGIVQLDIEIESPAFFITQDVSFAEYILFSLTSEELLFGDFWAQLYLFPNETISFVPFSNRITIRIPGNASYVSEVADRDLCIGLATEDLLGSAC